MGNVSRVSQEEDRSGELDSAYAWSRLVASLIIGSVGGIGMWSSVVLIPEIQGHFGVDRSNASLPLYSCNDWHNGRQRCNGPYGG